MPRLERLGERSITIEAKRLGTLIGLQSGASGPHAILGPSHSDAATTALARGDILGCVGSATLDAINIGGSGTYLRSDGTDPAWTALQTADMPALPTPGTCTVATSNSGTAPHTHAITSSSNPGAAASLLASDASGYLQLVGLGIGAAAAADNRVLIYRDDAFSTASNSTTDNILLVRNVAAGAGTVVGSIGFSQPNNAGTERDAAIAAIQTGSDNNQLGFAFFTHPTLPGADPIVEAMRVWHDGRLSIGHTTQYGFLDVRQDTTDGPTINAYRDLASGSTDSPVLRVVQDNAGDDQAAMYVQQDGTGNVMTLVDSNSNYVSVKNGPELLIGTDTSSANMLIGLLIDGDTYSNEAIAIKNSGNIAHGMTSVAETDVYGRMQVYVAGTGGLEITGLTESEVGLNLSGYVVSDDTGKTSAANAAIQLDARKKTGTTVGAMGSDANLAVIRNATTTVFIFDAEGSAHAEIEWTTFDEHDDALLLDALETEFARRRDPLIGTFGSWVDKQRALLQSENVVNFYDDGPRAMVNFTRLAMLHTGAIRQSAAKLRALEGRCERYERALLGLGVNPKELSYAVD